jgi:hypothetical protein
MIYVDKHNYTSFALTLFWIKHIYIILLLLENNNLILIFVEFGLPVYIRRIKGANFTSLIED